MHKNYFTLRAVAAQCNRTIGKRRFFEAYSHRPGELVLSFLGDDDVIDLRVITGVQQGCMFLTMHSNPPKRNVLRFFETIAGATVTGVSIAGSDRTVIINFGEAGELHIRMFGSGGGNVVRCGADGVPIESFKKERDADTRPFAPAKTWEDVLRDHETFSSALHNTSAVIGVALNKAVPAFGKPLVEEALHRATLDALVPVGDIGAAAMARLYQTVTAIVDECINAPQPRVYVNGSARFALIPLETMNMMTPLLSRDVSDGVRRWVAEHGKNDGAQQERVRIARMLHTYRQHLEQTIIQVRGDLASRKEDRWQRMGELLMEHIAEVPQGADGVSFDGVVIPLDASLTAGQNGVAYFDKAKHRKASVIQATRRLDNLIAKRDAVDAREKEFESVHTRDELEHFALKHHDLLKQMDHENPNAPKLHPYRSYRLSDDCEVYVGKNAKQNDELTFHFAKQNDLWFHVRGAEGSHTILRYDRRDAPPKEYIMKAAAIAAFHSKSKTSHLVPVLYTQRKYIHKPRGAKPGTVIAQREEVVMVTPGVPKE